ncbi:uncharacterized protein N7515_004560 [Penicillium bovifimosum]|uniref:Uncharacterized protein n=1 Tax=Penicillium bovifimosum TaxID=126998 RepID=A0A9W9H0B7_9EURO|nr:uncharacterized protein N7515_004560 [Penicillium bovifimosum]KAJ5135282.1 hypothetical protein N7515_004560 [Penicillium bovifimosum]
MVDPAFVLRPSGHLTPPLSPRKRRRYLRDSEDSEGEMSLQQYMHSTEYYRSVSLESPQPLPVKMEPAPALEQEISPLYPEVLAIMRRHNLNVNTTFECGKMSKPNTRLVPPQHSMVAQENDVLTSFGSLQKGDYCLKNGRTTYVTSGICNGAKAERDFCREGDSGAFILDRSGTVTGLLWGGLEHYGEDVGLVSSMSEVLEAIKEKIGGRVSVDLPQ